METVRLEAFSNPLRGKKILLIGDEQLISNRLHILNQECLGKGRKVLIITDGRKLPKWSLYWDAIFRIKDATDIRLVITYVTNTSRPLCVVWLGQEPSHQVQTFLTKNETTLLYSCVNKQPLLCEWDIIFFPLTVESSTVEQYLLPKLGSVKLGQINVKSVLNEVKAASVGIVWTNINDKPHGAIYWYDYQEGNEPHERLSSHDASILLKEIAERLNFS